MGKIQDLSRRRFIQFVGVMGGGRADRALAQAAKSAHVHHKTEKKDAAGPAKPFKVLDARQVSILEDIAEQMIPADSDPGARDAGVVRYIDRVLSDEQHSRLHLYESGIVGCNQTSKLLFNREFTDLKPEDQAAVLKALENGEAPGEMWNTVSSRDFFALVWTHVLEGFYGPPEHGGNKDYVSWKMAGFPV